MCCNLTQVSIFTGRFVSLAAKLNIPGINVLTDTSHFYKACSAKTRVRAFVLSELHFKHGLPLDRLIRLKNNEQAEELLKRAEENLEEMDYDAGVAEMLALSHAMATPTPATPATLNLAAPSTSTPTIPIAMVSLAHVRFQAIPTPMHCTLHNCSSLINSILIYAGGWSYSVTFGCSAAPCHWIHEADYSTSTCSPCCSAYRQEEVKGWASSP